MKNVKDDHDRAIVSAVKRLMELGVPDVVICDPYFRRDMLDEKVCVVRKGVDGQFDGAYFVNSK